MNVALFLEIKNEYSEHLIDTLMPFIYEGLRSLYNDATKIAKEGEGNDKVLMIFQKLLQSVDNWTVIDIDKETNRIKQASGTSEYLDDLVKAVIKSNIILLSYSNSISTLIAQSFYNNLSTPNLIHRCYIECAKDAHNNPFLFFHEVTPMDYKRNQIIVQQNIQSAIIRAIRKVLPIPLILKEYLANSVSIIDEPHIGNIKSEKKVEQDVMNIIKSEQNKTDKERINAIMNMDKLITSMKQEKDDKTKIDFGRRPSPVEKKQYNLLKPNKMNSISDYQNIGLHADDKKIININVNNDPTPKQPYMDKSGSKTSMSDNMFNKRNNGDILSERVDPKAVNYIEEYGSEKKLYNGRKKYN